MRVAPWSTTVPAMDPQLLAIAANHGTWFRHEAKDLGYHDPTIQRLVDGEIWHRVRVGSYTYRELWNELDTNQRYGLLCRSAYRRSETVVALSHRSSANEWATPLWDIALDEVDLTRQDGRTGRRAAGVAQHRGRILDGDWVEHNGLFVMSPTRTGLELTTMLDVEHSLVELDNLLHRELTTPDALASRFALMNHWPDTLHTDLILRLGDGRSESVGETRIRYLCWAQGLPAPVPNYGVRDSSGRVLYRVDLAWPELGLFLEFDGRSKYVRFRKENETVADCVERERRREHHIVELTGWKCIRVVWADLYKPVETAGRIRTLFSAPVAQRRSPAPVR